ncbi:MAG: acyl-protein synthetase [Thiocapsa sp.]|uniref:LuxE/PaaK family acyltransferase n=1 Tax=Thiocapsa sp. TaxID=2024551 RepID=UPI001BCAE8E6|nr:acyl-protein synthetase [Thiocapsa sp.]QVL50124.1 MAG: acyl-protein synthetase [Thiocapsa sp.]
MASLPPVVTAAPFAAPWQTREPELLDGLNALTRWHHAHCPPYARMLDGAYGTRAAEGTAQGLDAVPYLPARLFKHLRLQSVPDAAVVRHLTSSGTSGQTVSRIPLDAETSDLQIRTLGAITQAFIGRQRRPMLILDRRPRVDGATGLDARCAGALGFAPLGCQHRYAFDQEMQPRWDVIESFQLRWAGAETLVFGLTWIIWRDVLNAVRAAGRRFDLGAGAVLVHGGGWKRRDAEQVDRAEFAARVREWLGIRRVHEYYGMAEQAGAIFMACEAGVLHTSAFATVLMREPHRLRPAREGLIEVLSLVPRSYPGHAILTEDVGRLLGCDDCPCGRKGPYFQIDGRLPQAEPRGCGNLAQP